MYKIKVEEFTSILPPGAKTASYEQLYQAADGPGHKLTPTHHLANIKLIEAENKLNRVFEEYSGRIECFMLMLETLHEGVVIINPTSEICFANEAGNQLMSAIKTLQPGFFAYSELNAGQHLLLQLGTDQQAEIRVKNFVWNNEACNLFVMAKQNIVKPETTLVAQNTATPANTHNYLIAAVQQIAGYENAGNTTEALAAAQHLSQTVAQNEKLLAEIKLFTGLINYQPAITQVAMQKLVGDVLKSMGPEIEDAEVELSVSDLPDTKADKELIIKLMKHLLQNALKFRNKTRKAIIDIGCDKSEGQFIFCVRDNGLGISKKHHEEIFVPFCTLNPTNEYPGNGMGLAICKKIVALHDGKIWVESLPGHGSNFYFKLNAR